MIAKSVVQSMVKESTLLMRKFVITVINRIVLQQGAMLRQEAQILRKKVKEVIICQNILQVHTVNTRETESDNEPYIDDIVLDNISCNNYKNIWTTEITIKNKAITCKPDSGASCDCMLLHVLKNLNLDSKIKSSDLSLIAYGNNKLKSLGYIILPCKIKNTECNLKFAVVDTYSRRAEFEIEKRCLRCLT